MSRPGPVPTNSWSSKARVSAHPAACHLRTANGVSNAAEEGLTYHGLLAVQIPEAATWATLIRGIFGAGAVVRGQRKLAIEAEASA